MRRKKHDTSRPVVRRTMVKETSIQLLAKIIIAKYKARSLEEATKLGIQPYEILEETLPSELIDVFLNEGIDAMWTLVCGGSETAYSNANARIGVGNGTDAESATQTGLTGTSTLFKAMLSGFPTFGSGQKATFKSEFVDGEAEFAWEEFTVDNGNVANKNLHRKKISKGTKPSGETWTCQIELSIS